MQDKITVNSSARSSLVLRLYCPVFFARSKISGQTAHFTDHLFNYMRNKKLGSRAWESGYFKSSISSIASLHVC